MKDETVIDATEQFNMRRILAELARMASVVDTELAIQATDVYNVPDTITGFETNEVNDYE